jgi:phage replication-related protein YjqB (UPF0714/DUF867 family)
MATAGVMVSSATTALSRERCLVSADVLAALNADGALQEALADLDDAGRGFQLRLKRGPDQYALYTVAGRLPPAETGLVRMSGPGLARLDIRPGSVPANAEIDTRAVDTPPEAEFTEHVTGFGALGELVVIAPHGGMIEQHTDTQAEAVLAELSRSGIEGLHGARCWVCKGFRPGGGTVERWHITSTDLSEHSFPQLRAIMAPFLYAVSFHGFRRGGSGEGGVPPGTEIWIGGRASGKNATGKDRTEELRLLQDRIRRALQETPDDPRVRIAPPGSSLGGGSARNIVNRLSGCGLQIEQTPEARERDSDAPDFIGFGHDRIAQVVAETYIAALRDGLVDAATGERITDPVA